MVVCKPKEHKADMTAAVHCQYIASICNKLGKNNSLQEGHRHIHRIGAKIQRSNTDTICAIMEGGWDCEQPLS